MIESGQKNKDGFTIVELLIVIVVIAILAATTIIAFNGVQNRARDSTRMSDVRSITKALEMYKTTHGGYPIHQSVSTWELSYNYPTTFIAPLVTSNTVSAVPVDAVNTESGGYYKYYKYYAGEFGCDASKGRFYVFVIWKPGGGTSSQSPGFSCSARNWATEGWYVTGAYDNE